MTVSSAGRSGRAEARIESTDFSECDAGSLMLRRRFAHCASCGPARCYSYFLWSFLLQSFRSPNGSAWRSGNRCAGRSGEVVRMRSRLACMALRQSVRRWVIRRDPWRIGLDELREAGGPAQAGPLATMVPLLDGSTSNACTLPESPPADGADLPYPAAAGVDLGDLAFCRPRCPDASAVLVPRNRAPTAYTRSPDPSGGLQPAGGAGGRVMSVTMSQTWSTVAPSMSVDTSTVGASGTACGPVVVVGDRAGTDIVHLSFEVRRLRSSSPQPAEGRLRRLRGVGVIRADPGGGGRRIGNRWPLHYPGKVNPFQPGEIMLA